VAYQLIEFDGVDLPLYNPRQDHSPAPMGSALLAAIGGYVDYYGTRRGTAQSQALSITGVVWGETEYLVDEDCNFIVDENGDYIIGGNAAVSLTSQLAALRDKARRRGSLTRQRLSDSYREWKTAHFLEMRQPQEVRDRDFMATVTCTFEMIDPGWHSETATTAGRTLPAGMQKPLYVQNGGGMTVEDAVVTVTRISGTVTQVDIDCTAQGIDLRWTGSMATGSLVIDCGAATVRKAGADAYVTGFVQSGHTARTWLPLAQGTNELLVTVTGGDATVSVVFYAQNP